MYRNVSAVLIFVLILVQVLAHPFPEVSSGDWNPTRKLYGLTTELDLGLEERLGSF